MWFDVCEGVRLVSEFGVCDNDLVCFQYKLRDGEVEWRLSRSVLKECAVSPLEVVGVAGLWAGILKCGGWKALSACKQTSSSIATVSDPEFGLTSLLIEYMHAQYMHLDGTSMRLYPTFICNKQRLPGWRFFSLQTVCRAYHSRSLHACS